jgi:CheY-like chemotaxis protein
MLDVDTAEDGGAAVEMVGSNDYALILMDIQMPGMNGLEATRLIRLMPNGHDVPVIAITANAFDKDREACLDAGMNDFVAKPFDPPRLFAILLQWLSQGNQDKD